MRVNIYAEEMTNRVELVEKNGFTGVRFYLELPATIQWADNSAAVTFWGKAELRAALNKALALLDLPEPANLVCPVCGEKHRGTIAR